MKLIVEICLLCLIVSTAQAQEVYYDLPSNDEVVKRSIETAMPAVKADIYKAKSIGMAKAPVVIFLNSIGANWIREHPGYISWAKLVTAHGFAGITMASDEADPLGSITALLNHLKKNKEALGLDTENIVVYACSSNVMKSLPYLMNSTTRGIRGAMILYGYSTDVINFRLDLPVLYVRSGLDNVNLNRQIDEVTARAWKANAPWELINYASGHHAFDIADKTPRTKQIVAQMLDFMKHVTSPEFQKYLEGSIDEIQLAAYLNGDDYEAAKRHILKIQAASKSPNADLNQKLGDVYRNLGELDLALKAYDASIAQDSPNRGLISYEKAKIFFQKGDTAAVMTTFESLRQIAPIMNRLKNDPFFEPLRKNRKYDQLFR